MGSQLCRLRGSFKELESQLLNKPEIQNFLMKYPLIGQKFKLNNKYLPEPEFQSYTKKKNSILFKSTFTLIHNKPSENQYFPGLIFQQNLQDEELKSKPYTALCYQGRFNEFQVKEGQGFAIFDNGDIYEGEWKDKMIDGNGIYTQNQNKTIYEGHFRQWKKQGKGKLISNIDKKFTYEGEFSNNFIHGKGKIKFQNDSHYEGQFSHGYQQGHGIYETATMKYDGTWKAGLMSGAGTAVWYSDKGQIVSKYTGQYRQGKKHGFGQYEGKNRKILRGQWFKGKFNMGANSYIIQ